STRDSRSAWAWSAPCSYAMACPTCATWSRATCASPSRSASAVNRQPITPRRITSMFIPQSWVTDVVAAANPGWSVTPDELDAGFVRVGFETEGHEPLPPVTGPLVFGRVDDIEDLTEFKKPIRFCKVDVGDANGTGEQQGIISGARNFAEGDVVVVALPGAVLPGDFAIGARKTYGRISAGMLCSEAELGLTAESAGIIALPESVLDDADVEIGADARAFLGLDDELF